MTASVFFAMAGTLARRAAECIVWLDIRWRDAPSQHIGETGKGLRPREGDGYTKHRELMATGGTRAMAGQRRRTFVQPVVSATVGFLLGIVMVAWVRPDTSAGAIFLVLLVTLVCIAIGYIIAFIVVSLKRSPRSSRAPRPSRKTTPRREKP
jgi:hypothetical protein